MKIGSSPLADLPGAKPGDATTPDAARTQRSAAPPGLGLGLARAGDRVSLSSAASSASRLAASDAGFDAAKVQAIQAAIREGRFTVNAGAIADKLVAEAAAMITPHAQ